MVEKSSQVYLAARVIAVALKPSDPVRLGLALNNSVFYFEIMNNPDQAARLAKEVSPQLDGCIIAYLWSRSKALMSNIT